MRPVSFGERLLCLLFPARCVFCGEIVPAGEAFCESCKKHVPEEPVTRRYEVDGHEFRTLAPLVYTGAAREALHRLKFHSERSLARPLGRLMAEAARSAGETPQAVVWVPLRKNRKKERGYDQSELLARAAAKELGVPCLPVLEKVRDTGIQHDLSRREDRIENVKGAYGVMPGMEAQAAGKTLLLIDDIVTTGSTLLECAGPLYAAGAEKITGLCAADAPAPETG